VGSPYGTKKRIKSVEALKDERWKHRKKKPFTEKEGHAYCHGVLEGRGGKNRKKSPGICRGMPSLPTRVPPTPTTKGKPPKRREP